MSTYIEAINIVVSIQLFLFIHSYFLILKRNNIFSRHWQHSKISTSKILNKNACFVTFITFLEDMMAIKWRKTLQKFLFNFPLLFARAKSTLF